MSAALTASVALSMSKQFALARLDTLEARQAADPSASPALSVPIIRLASIKSVGTHVRWQLVGETPFAGPLIEHLFAAAHRASLVTLSLFASRILVSFMGFKK